jgi:hypothetical protein
MSHGYCDKCSSETVDYCCPKCDGDEIVRLRAANAALTTANAALTVERDAAKRERDQLDQERTRLRIALSSVPVLNFLRQHRNKLFQMQGAYDGAMSKDCKELFRAEYETINKLIVELKAK